MKSAIVFFPHNPSPPRTGAHQRFLELAQALIKLDYAVHLVSSRMVSETPWNDESLASLKKLGLRDIRVHRAGPVDLLVAGPIVLGHRLTRRPLPVASRAFAPPGMQQFFRKACDEIQPSLLLMHYAYWDRLVDHARYAEMLCLLDTIDLLTLNTHMRQALLPAFSAARLQPDDIPDHYLKEDFFEQFAGLDCSAEYQIYDRYNVTLAISQREARLIQANTRKTRVEHVPMTQAVPEMTNDYGGAALFPASSNLFNLQGFAYFVRRVLPLVRARHPGFELRLTGAICAKVAAVPGVQALGFVPNLAAEYAAARFMVCPVFGGTGQQVKIVEAMAHGLPVVALRTAAEQSPLRHGENGLVAGDAAEFSEHVNTLWTDARLCRQLGEQARLTIATDYSDGRLLCQMNNILAGAN